MAAFERDPFRRLGRVFQFGRTRADAEAEIEAEIAEHLRRTEEALVADGMSPEAARREATRRFGDPERHRRQLREIDRLRLRRQRPRRLLGGLVESARGALRGLRAAPGVAVVVIVTLALGIGANAVMFGVVDRLLLTPPAHVVDPDDVVRIAVRRAGIAGETVVRDRVTYPDYRDWTTARGFATVAAVNAAEQEFTLGDPETAIRVSARKATASLFPLLGVRPQLGRFFTEEEDTVGGGRVVVLGHDLWTERFGGDPGVVGSEVILGGKEHEVIGVAPREFTGFDLQRVDVWVPLRSPASDDDPSIWQESRRYWFLVTVARLAPGTTAESAAAVATSVHRAGRADMDDYDSDAAVVLGPLLAARGELRSTVSVVARWLVAVSAIVLIVACANVANMLLARGLQRRREIGVRLALGISGPRLALDLLVESVVLGLLGGAAALLVVWQGSGFVRALLLPEIQWGEVLDARVLGFTFAAAIATGALAGIAPAIHARRLDVAGVLGGGVRAGSATRSSLRTAMLVVQTALSVTLLVGAGLFVRSLGAVRSIDMGFEPSGLLVALPEVDREQLTFAERGEFYRAAVRRVRSLPAVESATTAMTVPFHSGLVADLVIPDVPEPPELPTGGPYLNVVSDDFFETMRLRTVAGRPLDGRDVDGAPRAVVIDEALAEAYWPTGDALGRCLRLGADDPCRSVVGIVESSARENLLPATVAQYYVPLEQVTASPLAILVRVAPGTESEMAGVVQREVRGGVLGVRFVQVQSLQSMIEPEARAWRLGATLFSVFGALALAIAAVGVYGVTAFSVARRRHEMGVRAALGAAPGSIVRLVLGRSLGVAAASAALGIGLALAAGPWMAPLLYGVSPRDPWVLGAVAGILLAVTMVAVLVPAGRASRVDPVVTLRSD